MLYLCNLADKVRRHNIFKFGTEELFVFCVVPICYKMINFIRELSQW